MSNSPFVLLIDANHEDREYYTQCLRSSSPDFVVLHATTGRSGLELCTQQPIDCIVLEIDLSAMSGFEVLPKLIPVVQHPEIAVIILTRNPNQYFLEAAIKNGAQAALHKGTTSGDTLGKAILDAIAAVQKDRKRTEVKIAI